MVGVAWAGETSTYQAFVDRYRITFPQGIDTQGELFAHFGVPGQPAWVFVGRDGRARTHLGELEPDELSRAFDALLA